MQTVLKKGILILWMLAALSWSGMSAGSVLAAPLVEVPCRIAVMDFGSYPGAFTSEVQMKGANKSISDYLIEQLLESGKFILMDKDMYAEKLQAAGIKYTGRIDPDSAQKIGELLGVPYIVYGNLGSLVVSENTATVMGSGAKVHTVRAQVVARVMDVRTGEIITAAKGEGKSDSAIAKLGSESAGYVTVGTSKVTQISVHNAVRKATVQTAELLTEKLCGKNGNKRKN